MLTTLAPRLDLIKPSPSMAATARAAELRAAGVDVISMTVGEPDFDTPEHIRRAACDAIEAGQTRYTRADGTPELKAAIARKFKRENGLEYSPEEIHVASGAKQVIYNALMASLAPGDEVIVPAPYWVSYTDMVMLAEGVPKVIQCPAEEGFKLKPEVLAAAITPRTRWLMLNTPSNPSGAILSRDELTALAEVLADHPHVMVMTDDIYEHIRFDGRPFHTMAQVFPDLRDRTLTVNGVSKAYSMTGWRIGYAGGPAGLIKGMLTLAMQTTTNPCSVSQAAATAALDGPQDHLAERARIFQARRDLGLGRIADIPGLTCERPQGAFYLFPGVQGLIGKRTPDGRVLGDDNDVVLYLLDRARVALVQGAAFGLPGHVRMSIATSEAMIDAAFDRIAEAVGQLS